MLYVYKYMIIYDVEQGNRFSSKIHSLSLINFTVHKLAANHLFSPVLIQYCIFLLCVIIKLSVSSILLENGKTNLLSLLDTSFYFFLNGMRKHMQTISSY